MNKMILVDPPPSEPFILRPQIYIYGTCEIVQVSTMWHYPGVDCVNCMWSKCDQHGAHRSWILWSFLQDHPADAQQAIQHAFDRSVNELKHLHYIYESPLHPHGIVDCCPTFMDLYHMALEQMRAYVTKSDLHHRMWKNPLLDPVIT